MTAMQNNKTGTSITVLLVSILSVLLPCGLPGGEPSVNLATTIATPRVGMLQSDESTYWATTVNYDQRFGQKFRLESQFELGSETDLLPNPFRVYNLAANFELSKLNIRLGRLTHWSNLAIGRVDGIDIKYSLGKIGTLNFFGGFNAVTDFSDTAFTDKQMFLFSWGRGIIGKNQTVSFWSFNDGAETHTFTGLSIAQPLAGFKINGAMAWSLSAGQLYHGRLRISRILGKHVVAVGFRQRRYLVANPYPWVDATTLSTPQTSVGVKSRLAKDLQWWNQLNYRSGENGSIYLRSTALWKIYSLSLVYGSYGNNTLTGVNLGLNTKLPGGLIAGGSVSLNAVDYDDLIEPQNSLGAYGWLGWKPAGKLSGRLFVRYHKNPYYKYDVRGGMVLNVAI